MEEKQLVIFRSSGLSNSQIASPALLVAAILALFSYYISLELMPSSYTKLRLTLNDMRNNYVSSAIAEKTFNNIAKSMTIYLDKKESDGMLKGIVIFDNRAPKRSAIFFAKEGSFLIGEDNLPLLILKEGSRQSYDENGNITWLYFDSSTVELSNKNRAAPYEKSDLNEFYLDELFWPASNLSPGRKARLISEAHQRLLWPGYTMLLTSLGIAIFLRAPYNRKSSMRGVLSAAACVIGLVYFHFSIQNNVYKNPNLVPAYYVNLASGIVIAILAYRQKSLKSWWRIF